jgi:hypothetical protein
VSRGYAVGSGVAGQETELSSYTSIRTRTAHAAASPAFKAKTRA